MGFHYTTALLAAGVRNLVGGYYEPDGLLKANSEVHLARMARVEGLKIYAREIGANFSAFYKDLVIPQWRNKDDHKNPLPRPIIHEKPFPEQVRQAIESARRLSWVPDLHLANSIAFAQHMSPSPGMERLLGIPTVDIQGRIIMMDMKPYDEEKYQQGTIDPMGRNHEYLLRSLSHFFGPQSTSYFFTWAGGSQNRHILRGVYGDGALGDAKEMGETAAIRYHLESQDNGFNRGYHKIVRFPDFPTFALFGIPGGGGMGLIARHVLESHDRFFDVPDLAPLSLIAALGGENNLRNVAAQIELDAPESYHIQEISEDIGEFHRRARQYRQEHPERWKFAGMQKIATLQSIEDAKEILLGSAAAYRREHPELEGRPIPPAAGVTAWTESTPGQRELCGSNPQGLGLKRDF
jgi:enoyl-[acyl-carrier protein] reductase / trans-2-enoyl-CoA reductase (NAD+)